MSCRYVHCGLSLLNRNASFQFSNDGKPARIIDAGTRRISLSVDYVNLWSSPAEQIKPGFEDARNWCRKRVDKDLLVEHVRIAREMPLPELVTDQNAGAGLVDEVDRGNGTEEGLDSEQR